MFKQNLTKLNLQRFTSYRGYKKTEKPNTRNDAKNNTIEATADSNKINSTQTDTYTPTHTCRSFKASSVLSMLLTLLRRRINACLLIRLWDDCSEMLARLDLLARRMIGPCAPASARLPRLPLLVRRRPSAACGCSTLLTRLALPDVASSPAGSSAAGSDAAALRHTTSSQLTIITRARN